MALSRASSRYVTTLPELPGWELRMGGNVLRGQWRFRKQETAAAFAWAALMQCFLLDYFPDVMLWNQAVTVEARDLKRNANLPMAEVLATAVSKVTGPPQLRPIDTPSPYLVTLEKNLRTFEFSQLFLNLIQVEPTDEKAET